MSEQNRQKTRAAFLKLPPNIQEEFESQAGVVEFSELVKKYQLEGEKIDLLSEAIGLVLSGAEPQEKLPNLISSIVGLDTEKSKMIAQESLNIYMTGSLKDYFTPRIMSTPIPSTTPIRSSLRSEGPTSFDTVEVVGEEKPKVTVPENISQADVLEGIEHPTAFPAVFEKPGLPATGFVADKLSKIVTAPKSTGEVKTTPPPKYSQDPYRESTE